MTPAPLHLTDRHPSISAEQLAEQLVPPPQFAHASFAGYRPDRSYPSQAEAVRTLELFASAEPNRPGGFFSRRRKPNLLPGVYLDGGFGVGKTHLLAALWHNVGGRKYYGTFIEYTALVGALGYAKTVEMLKGSSLLCIDEFELDDPGDTMMMTRLLGALVAGGTRIAATSNTPPNALGEGRFAAQDFLREIQSMAQNFQTVRIDGLDYRRRDMDQVALCLSGGAFERTVDALLARGAAVSVDAFADLIGHLASIHPSRYVGLLHGLQTIVLADVTVLHDQTDALRLVAFVDRVYDDQIPIVASGVPLSEVFDDEMLAGGYRKKYLRAISRLIALTNGELPPDADSDDTESGR